MQLYYQHYQTYSSNFENRIKNLPITKEIMRRALKHLKTTMTVVQKKTLISLNGNNKEEKKNRFKNEASNTRLNKAMTRM